MTIIVLAAIALGLAWQPAHLAAPHVAPAPMIDGHLDDPAWQRAAWTDDFVDIEGENRPIVPRYRTRAAVCWDDRALYIAADLADPHVWGTLTERDAVIFHDNDFEVFLDPDSDHHLYGELEINALNTVWDLLLVKPYRDNGAAINGWTMVGLETAVAVVGTLNDPTDTDGGWTVEIAIPWTALKDIARDRACPPEPGEWWRMNLSRVQWEHRLEDGRYMRAPVVGRGWKGEDNWVWSPQGVVAMHQPETWGFVTFVGADGAVASDPREAMRAVYEILWPVYGAQVAYHEEHGRYATRLADLDDVDPVVPGLRLDATATTWTATFDGWTVAHDGRLTAP